MSDTQTADTQTDEGTESVTEKTEQQNNDGQLPADHPLVKTLNALKSENKELKGKARRLNEIEEASKSEAEKMADRVAKAESEVSSIPSKVADALRTHLVDLHEIDKDDAELFLTASEPELLLKQVARLMDQSGKRRKNYVPREGGNPSATETTTSDMREFTRNLFNRDG